MYDIWLTLNIGWEIAVEWMPWSLVAALLLAALVAAAATRPGRAWRQALAPAATVGIAAAALAAVFVPGLTRASLSEMAYWIDWLVLLGVAAAIGGIAAAFAWPIAALLRPARR